MINYASTPPPEELVIGGTAYPIDTDYRTWIEVTELLKQAEHDNGYETWERLQELIFGSKVSCDVKEALEQIITFLAGYPAYEKGGGDRTNKEPVYSFVYDINMIVLAICNQRGIDISYRCRHFHWWEFLLEFQSLEERHYISKVIGYRSYEGEDKELLKLKKTFALPVERTIKEQREAQELSDMFYGC